MEPVVWHKAMAPVRRADRIRRAKPREDAGGGSPFARFRRPSREPADSAADTPAEVPGETLPSQGPEAAAERGDHPAGKTIDIRV